MFSTLSNVRVQRMSNISNLGTIGGFLRLLTLTPRNPELVEALATEPRTSRGARKLAENPVIKNMNTKEYNIIKKVSALFPNHISDESHQESSVYTRQKKKEDSTNMYTYIYRVC